MSPNNFDTSSFVTGFFSTFSAVFSWPAFNAAIGSNGQVANRPHAAVARVYGRRSLVFEFDQGDGASLNVTDNGLAEFWETYLTSQTRRSSCQNSDNLIESVNARKELATKAVVTRDTIAKYMRAIGFAEFCKTGPNSETLDRFCRILQNLSRHKHLEGSRKKVLQNSDNPIEIVGKSWCLVKRNWRRLLSDTEKNVPCC